MTESQGEYWVMMQGDTFADWTLTDVCGTLKLAREASKARVEAKHKKVIIMRVVNMMENGG